MKNLASLPFSKINVFAENIDLYKIAYGCAKNALQVIQVYLEHEVVKKLKVVSYTSPHVSSPGILHGRGLIDFHVSFVRRFNDPLFY